MSSPNKLATPAAPGAARGRLGPRPVSQTGTSIRCAVHAAAGVSPRVTRGHAFAMDATADTTGGKYGLQMAGYWRLRRAAQRVDRILSLCLGDAWTNSTDADWFRSRYPGPQLQRTKPRLQVEHVVDHRTTQSAQKAPQRSRKEPSVCGATVSRSSSSVGAGSRVEVSTPRDGNADPTSSGMGTACSSNGGNRPQPLPPGSGSSLAVSQRRPSNTGRHDPEIPSGGTPRRQGSPVPQPLPMLQIPGQLPQLWMCWNAFETTSELPNVRTWCWNKRLRARKRPWLPERRQGQVHHRWQAQCHPKPRPTRRSC